MEKSLKMKSKTIPRHEFWRQQYRANRYARHLSRLELNKRIRDIVLNMLRVTPEATVGVFPVGEMSGIWWEKWTHVLEEMVIRYGPFPAGFDRDVLHFEPFPKYGSELARKAAKRMSALGLHQGSVLIKFGKRCYMEQLHEHGQLRLQPASIYSRPNLNLAVRDDEMTLPLTYTLTRKEIVGLVSNPQDVPEGAEQRMNIEFVSRADFWLYCLTCSVEPRLFVDFNADACVIIRKPDEFARKLREGVRASTGNAEVREGRVNYVDPLLPKSLEIFVPLSKPFGYSYQDEYRFCCLQASPVERLDPVDIEIGSLAGIADIIVL